MKIQMTGVIVNDPLVAYKFYTEVLGFVKVMYMPEDQLAIVASPDDADGTSLILEPNENEISKTFQSGIYDLGLPVIIFGTDDIQSEYERLKNLGVKFKKSPVKTDWGWEAIFDDTCGNFIQIYQKI